jgi:DNA-binding transcriptional regulator YiaG
MSHNPTQHNPTPSQVRAARIGAGLTQSQAASFIGAALRTWQDWESGARNMPPAKWILFTMMIDAPRN